MGGGAVTTEAARQSPQVRDVEELDTGSCSIAVNVAFDALRKSLNSMLS